jgi:hypothetical protein
MDASSSSTQSVPRRRGRRHRSSHITIPQFNSNTSHANRRIHKARINVVTDPHSLGNECTNFCHIFPVFIPFLSF